MSDMAIGQRLVQMIAPKLQRLSFRDAMEPQVESNGRMAEGGELVRPALWLLGGVLAVVLSALAVIYSAYEYRKLFNQHQILVQQGDDLQVEWGQLLLEQSAWGAISRVENQARSKLDMVTPEPDNIEIVRHGQ